MLHDVEFVIDQPALGYPLFQTQAKGFVHVHAGRFDPLALPSAQLGLKKPV
jgi:hypothetical protein